MKVGDMEADPGGEDRRAKGDQDDVHDSAGYHRGSLLPRAALPNRQDVVAVSCTSVAIALQDGGALPN